MNKDSLDKWQELIASGHSLTDSEKIEYLGDWLDSNSNSLQLMNNVVQAHEVEVKGLQEQMNTIAEAIELLTGLIQHYTEHVALNYERVDTIIQILDGMSDAIITLQGRKE